MSASEADSEFRARIACRAPDRVDLRVHPRPLSPDTSLRHRQRSPREPAQISRTRPRAGSSEMRFQRTPQSQRQSSPSACDAAATVERRGASSSDDAGSALISVVKGIESRLALFLRLASATGDRPSGNCFSNCIDLSRKPLARETLPCVCWSKIPALEIKATVVTRRAAFLVSETGNSPHRERRPTFTCLCSTGHHQSALTGSANT